MSLGIHLCGSRGQKRLPPALLPRSAYSFESGSVSNPGARLAARPREAPVSGIRGGCRSHASFCFLFFFLNVGIGIHIQALDSTVNALIQ